MLDISYPMNVLMKDNVPPFLAFLILRGGNDESVHESDDAVKSVSSTKTKSILSTTGK